MNPSEYQVRRATLDDIAELKALWQTMRFSDGDLEKRLTEFQVVAGPDNKVVGALGFRMAERQGQVHSESFADFAVADAMRPLLWTRVQSLATNHGIFRLWTQERAPFWTQNGFQPANEQVLQRLPAAWKAPNASWLTLQLKDEEAIASLEKEFAMFVESEKQRSAQALDQARTLKSLVTIIALLIAAGIFVAAIYVFVKNKSGGALPPGP
jgi:N-acetylglutamate synthase-like GNAT family acetyltransferase